MLRRVGRLALVGSLLLIPARAAPGQEPRGKAGPRVQLEKLDRGLSQLRVSFPDDSHPQRTSWRVVLTTRLPAVGAGKTVETLAVERAFFRPRPDGPEYKVLGLAELNETVVAYNDGKT